MEIRTVSLALRRLNAPNVIRPRQTIALLQNNNLFAACRVEFHTFNLTFARAFIQACSFSQSSLRRMEFLRGDVRLTNAHVSNRTAASAAIGLFVFKALSRCNIDGVLPAAETSGSGSSFIHRPTCCTPWMLTSGCIFGRFQWMG